MTLNRVLSFPLRLPPSQRLEATKLAHQDGISLNRFISLAVAEKISRLEYEGSTKEQGEAALTIAVARPNTYNPYGLPTGSKV